MESVSFPRRAAPQVSVSEALFFLLLALFLVVACVWPILTARIHHFSTWTPDAVHSFVLHERGATFYLTPTLGKFYVNLPWIWCSLLTAAVLVGLLTGKKAGSRT
jgi:uncharacterized membrane protein